VADFSNTISKYEDNYSRLTEAAKACEKASLVDTTARVSFQLIGCKPMTPHEKVAEYYHFDWDYAQTPEVPAYPSLLILSSTCSNLH